MRKLSSTTSAPDLATSTTAESTSAKMAARTSIQECFLEPRIVTQRTTSVFEHFEVEAVIPPDHPAWVVWSYVRHTDLSALRAALRDDAHIPGQPSPDLRVVLALWLYASIEGVGSARRIVCLSETHDGFRWLRGGVPISWKLLSNFRWQAAVIVDRLLVQGIVALWSVGLVSFASLNDDYVRIRTSSGASSLRRLAKMDRLLAEAEERIARLRQEIDADSIPTNRHLRTIYEWR